MRTHISKALRWLVDANIPKKYLGNEHDAMRSRVLVAVMLGMVFMELLTFLLLGRMVAFTVGGRMLAYNMLSFILTSSIAALISFRLLQRRELTANLFAFCLGAALVYTIWYTGGVDSVVLPVMLLLPVFIGVTAGSRWGFCWTVLVLLTFFCFLQATRSGYEFEQIMAPQNHAIVQMICLGATCLLVSVAVLQYETATTRLWHELHRERTDLDYLARHDQLTGLPNRRHFSEELDKALSRARRNNNQFALVFFDLNGFKAVNDLHGHAVGDELLKVLARRLSKRFRSTDFVARWGGDEFAMVLENIASDAGLQKVIHAVVEETGRTVTINDFSFTVETSIGVAMYPADGEDSKQLMSAADKAMYRAKGQPDSPVFVCSPVPKPGS